MKPYAFLEGDQFRCNSFASLAEPIDVRAVIEYENGRRTAIPDFTHTSSTDRTMTISRSVRFTRAGRVVDAVILGRATAKRGRVWTELTLEDGDTQLTRDVLAIGYIDGTKGVSLGEFENSLSGRGWLRWEEVFTDRVGDAAAVDFSLAATNALRKIYGLAWYYHSSGDADTRTFQTPQLLNAGPTKPTGWTTTGATGAHWLFSANITLTVNEEGFFYANALHGGGAFGSRGDQGSATIENAASAPIPFPLWVEENDLAIIRFPTITTGNANDRHSAYILMEEWIEV